MRKFRQRLSTVCSIAAIVFAATSAVGGEGDTAGFTLLRTYCVDCHGSGLAEAELDLEPLLAGQLDAAEQGILLRKMSRRIEAGEMPPEDAGALDLQEKATILHGLAEAFDALAERYRDDPGSVVIPRLTAAQYRNVVRDLTDGIVTGGGDRLPNEGGAGEGFSNVGEAQGMTAAHFEKYVDAAKGVLRHLRVTPHDGFVWRSIPRDAVDQPAHAVKEAVDDIIAWHTSQQQQWGEYHRNDLTQRLGFNHAAYLEAAWQYRRRLEAGDESVTFQEIAAGYDVPLGPVSLRKWWKILNDESPDSPFSSWAKQWRELPLEGKDIRRRCIAIVSGDDGEAENLGDYAPSYEISFHEAKEEVLQAAEEEGYWPFRIDIGQADELFLVVTDAGDGGAGEFAVWRRGRFVFRDGTSRPWQETITLLGANSGREYPFGIDGRGAPALAADSIGVKPPGALKFVVPENAMTFEVELTLDENLTKTASIQALVLKEKPRSQSFIPGRYVFGGRKRAAAGDGTNKARNRLLRIRNVAEANRTKRGLNAELNIFRDWDRTELETIGGPWPDQEAEEAEPRAPYHFTVAELRENVTAEALAERRLLEDRLVSIAAPPAADVLEARALEWVSDFARRAWRRPLRKQELESFRRLYREAAAQGTSFDSAVKLPLLSVLISPNFLFQGGSVTQTEQARGETIVPLTPHELAGRLSFFLWASIPDEELLQLAESGRLAEPQVLRRQARRMLKDAKARSLAADFAAQAFDFADFETFSNPDAARFPEFTAELRRSMAAEVVAFLSEVFLHDRPLTLMLDSDFTFADRDLARHYGLGPEDRIDGTVAVDDLVLQRYRLPGDRGGLTGMALFLTKTSLPLRTSPVQRGVWVTEQLLGRPLPNPPADIPPLSEDDKDAAGLTIIEQLERHRADRSCAACHDKIDPLGLALEEYDAIGRIRVDTTSASLAATTHDAVRIEGASGLRAYLLERQEEFLQHFYRKLLGYALGRAVLPGDVFLLQKMTAAAEEQDHRFSALVDEIITAPQFRMRRVD